MVHSSSLWKLLAVFSLILFIVHDSAGIRKQQQRTSRLTEVDDPSLFKEPQQFECESEGFHPNPVDCSIFHLCVDRSQTSVTANTTDQLGTDSFISITFECNPGFFFDPKIDSCQNATKSFKGECLRDVAVTNAPDARFAGDKNPPRAEAKKPTIVKKPISTIKQQQQSKPTTNAKNSAKPANESAIPSAKKQTTGEEAAKSSTIRAPLVSVSVQNGNDFSNRLNFALDTSYTRQNGSRAHAVSHSADDEVKSRFNDAVDEGNSNRTAEKPTNKQVIYILTQPSQPHDEGATDSIRSITTTAASENHEKSSKSAAPATKKPLVLVVRRKNVDYRNGTAFTKSTPKPKTNQSQTTPPVKRPSLYLEPPPLPSSSKNATVDNESPVIYIIPPPGTLQNSALFGSQPRRQQSKSENEPSRDISATEVSSRHGQDGNEQEPDDATQYHAKSVPKPSIYLLPPISLWPDEVATLSPRAPFGEGDYYSPGSGFDDTGDNVLDNSRSNPQPTTYHPEWENGSNTPQPDEYNLYTHNPNIDPYNPLHEGQWQTPSVRLLPPTEFPSRAQSQQTSTLSSRQSTKQANYNSQNRLDSKSNFNSQPRDHSYTPSPAQFWQTFNPYSSYNQQPSQSVNDQKDSRQSNIQPQWHLQPQPGAGVTTQVSKGYPVSKPTNGRNPNGLESRSGLDSQWDDSVPSWSPPQEHEYTEAVSDQDFASAASTPVNYYHPNGHSYIDPSNGVVPQQINTQNGGYTEGYQLETSTPYYGYDPQQQTAETPAYGYDPQQQSHNNPNYGYHPQTQIASTPAPGYYPQPPVISTTVNFGRSLPKMAACVEDGFFAIENDCSRFYRCVSAGAGFQKFTFSCGPGTVWDSNINACNHGWAAHRQDC